MKFEFTTEWLGQIELLAAGGTAEDVKSLCSALKILVEEGRRTDMTVLAAMAYNPIASEIEKNIAKSERNRANAKRKQSETVANHERNGSETAKEEREEEKEKNQKKENKEKEDITDSVDNTCNNIASVLSPSSVCAEPENSASAPTEPPISTFLLVDGTEFPVTRDIYDRLARAYPAVDTMQQLREIETWCFANPKYRKTKNGAMRFLNNWFSREQDKGLTPKHAVRNKAQPRLTAEEVYNLPAINPWIGEGG